VTTVTHKNSPQVKKRSKVLGSALILALFIIIVLTFLGTALVRVLSTSSESIAQEVIGTRALMAANSGMQAHLQKLFPLSGVDSCPVNKTYNLPETGTDIPGLYHCVAKASCSLYFTHAVTGINYYRLTSTGECGSGVIDADAKNVVLSRRSVKVEARSL
jgi:MSHA biogenesis protein MshP